jgi:hypothetical protein
MMYGMGTSSLPLGPRNPSTGFQGGGKGLESSSPKKKTLSQASKDSLS